MYRVSRELKNRFLLMSLGILGMGFFLSFIIEVNYGTDTCTFMNLGMSQHFGILFGTCMLITNLTLFIPQFIFNKKTINIGTFMNMFLIGYISDFCRYLWSILLPADFFIMQPYRTIVFIFALIPFLISAALYMNAGFGLSPFDAIPLIISNKLKFPFMFVRMFWDFSAILFGLFLGYRLTVATVILAVSVGPTVSYIGKLLDGSIKLIPRAVNPSSFKEPL